MLRTIHTENDSFGQERHAVSAAPGADSDRRVSSGVPFVIAFFIVLGAVAFGSVIFVLWYNQ